MNDFTDKSVIVNEMILNCYKDRIVWIKGEIDEDMAFTFNRVCEKLVEEDLLLGEKKPIFIKVDSPGGELLSTLSIISQIETLRELGYKIVGMGYGKVMSGGLFVLMCCDKRFSQRHSRFLLHSVISFEIGGISTIQSTSRNLKDTQESWNRLREITKKYTKIDDVLLDDVTDNGRDYFFFPERAVELGIIDYII